MNYFDSKKLTTKKTNNKNFKIRAKLGSPGRDGWGGWVGTGAKNNHRSVRGVWWSWSIALTAQFQTAGIDFTAQPV
jgi:hypothetical protein